MEYRELQQKLKVYRDQGLTTIKLSAAKIDLEAELERLEPTATGINNNYQAFEPFDPLMVALELEEEATTQSQTESESTEPRTLPLNLSKKWFDMIASGEKKEEYRAIKPHYESRFNKRIDFVKFRLGYATDAPTVTVELLGISKGIAKPEWSDPHLFGGSEQEVFVLKLGKIVDSEQEPPQPEPDLNAKIESFFQSVERKELTQEQLEAIAFALTVAQSQKVPICEALAKNKQFQLFSPQQLLDWGFDLDCSLINFQNLSSRFKQAIAHLRHEEVSVIVQYIPVGSNGFLIESWAESYQGKLDFKPQLSDVKLVEAWVKGNEPSDIESEFQEDKWTFPSIELAEKFVEYCSKLDFVKSAKVDRIASKNELARAS